MNARTIADIVKESGLPSAEDVKDLTLDVMLGLDSKPAPTAKKSGVPASKREVISRDEQNAKMVLELQVTGPEYWHLANVVKGTEMVLGIGASMRTMAYAVQVKDNTLTVYDREGAVVFSGPL